MIVPAFVCRVRIRVSSLDRCTCEDAFELLPAEVALPVSSSLDPIAAD